MAKSRDKNKNPNELTDREALFVSYYLGECRFNGTNAAIKAGYTENRAYARVCAAELLAKPNIRKEIDDFLAERRMSAKEAIDRISRMARAEMTDIAEPNEAGAVDFKLYDKDEKGQYIPRETARFIKRLKIKKTITTLRGGDTIEVFENDVMLYDAKDASDIILKLNRVYDNGIQDDIAVNNPLPALPADLIAPDFLNVYRDLKAKRHTEYVLKGGRGSTKSAFGGFGFIYTIINNPDIHGLVIRQIGNTLRDSVFNQLLWAIDELGLSDLFRSTVSPLCIIYLPTGQKIYFRGANDPARIKSIKPKFGYIGVLWFEELDQFHGPESVRKIEQSVIRGGETAIIIKTFNPPRTAQNWVNKYCLIPKESQLQHHSTYLTVPVEWLGPAFIAEAEHLKRTNLAAYEHEYLGIVNGTGGNVFTNLDIRPITDSEIAQFDNVLYGADWGYIDPFSFGKMHYDANLRILYIYDEYRAVRKSNQEVANDLQDLKGLEPHHLIIADSSEPKSVKDFQAYGLNCRGAMKGPESRNYSYKWLQSLASIVIDSSRCPTHAAEFQDKEYPQDKDGNYISEYSDGNDHAIDDTRYATNLIWMQRGK